MLRMSSTVARISAVARDAQGSSQFAARRRDEALGGGGLGLQRVGRRRKDEKSPVGHRASVTRGRSL